MQICAICQTTARTIAIKRLHFCTDCISANIPTQPKVVAMWALMNGPHVVQLMEDQQDNARPAYAVAIVQDEKQLWIPNRRGITRPYDGPVVAADLFFHLDSLHLNRLVEETRKSMFVRSPIYQEVTAAATLKDQPRLTENRTKRMEAQERKKAADEKAQQARLAELERLADLARAVEAMVECEGVALSEAIDWLIADSGDRVRVYEHRMGWYRQRLIVGLRASDPEEFRKIAHIERQLETERLRLRRNSY